MGNDTLKKAYYIVLGILILLFFTKDIDLKNNQFYKNIKLVENTDSLLVLVNKNNQLPSYYIPNNLEEIDKNYAHDHKLVRRETRLAFEKLSQQAKDEGYRIVAVSGYRDYDYQKKLFEGYVKDKGLEYALNCSSKAGHSEHQTGLAIDVEGSNRDYDHFEDAPEFTWMQENAYKYGFILRYPKGKEFITGFKYEPWHYRYVGKEVAAYIHKYNITLEEYLFNEKR